MADVVFHIGLHKTATTTLQNQFFPKVPGLNYLDGPAVDEFVQRVTTADPAYFDADAAREALVPLLSETAPNLMSKEAFSGPLYAGVGKRGLDHRTPILMNLRRAFPEARVTLTLRRQDAYARSVYRQYLKFGGTEPADRFFGLDGAGIFPVDRLRYGPYLRYLSELFEGRVLLLTYEELGQEAARFLGRFCEFLGVESPDIALNWSNRTTLGARGMEVTRLANRLFRNQLNPGGLLPGVPRVRKGKLAWVNPVMILHDRWPGRGRGRGRDALAGWSERLLEGCREDNARIDSEFGLELKRFGYY